MFTVRAVGTNGSIEITKEKRVPVRCERFDLDGSDIRWNGVGNAEIVADGAPYPVTVTVVYDTGGSGDCTENGTCKTASVTVDKSEKVRSQGNQLVAIEIKDDDFKSDRFENPNYPRTTGGNSSNETNSSGAGGSGTGGNNTPGNDSGN